MAAVRSQRRSSRDDDVPDPIGLPVEVHAQVGETIARALIPVLARFAQLAPGV